MSEEKQTRDKAGKELFPVLPLRDIVVFPHMIVPLFVAREKSIRALEEVTRSDRLILLDTMFDLPGFEGVEEVVINREVADDQAKPLYIYADRRGDVGSSA
jgi:ATP-dependent Lon protease